MLDSKLIIYKLTNFVIKEGKKQTAVIIVNTFVKNLNKKKKGEAFCYFFKILVKIKPLFEIKRGKFSIYQLKPIPQKKQFLIAIRVFVKEAKRNSQKIGIAMSIVEELSKIEVGNSKLLQMKYQKFLQLENSKITLYI